MRLIKKVMTAASLLLLMITLSTSLISWFSTASETKRVVLNEVMYNPHGDEPENEWIELYNMEEYPVNITGWYIADDPDFISPGREGSYCFPSNTIIDDGECLIVAYSGKSFLNKYGFYPDYEMENSTLLVSDMIQVNKGFNLANNGDDMHLFDIYGMEVDKMWYGNGGDEDGDNEAETVSEGCSLARYRDVYTGYPKNDFYEECSPSPGEVNGEYDVSTFSIDFCPDYVAKIHQDSEYSLPFAIRVSLINFEKERCYELKAYVVGNLSNSHPATQTWDGETWRYSTNYVIHATTDNKGKWSGTVALRFKKSYLEYKESIWSGSKAYVVVKYRDDCGKTKMVFQPVNLLDMDDSTRNGLPGGYKAGVLEKDVASYKNSIVMLKNRSGNITGLYLLEDNHVDDGYPAIPGFYKITSPVGTGYTLEVWNEKGIIYNVGDITIEKGSYGFSIKCEGREILMMPNEGREVSLTVMNTGNFSDTIYLYVDSTDSNLNVSIKSSSVFLYPKEIYDAAVIIQAEKDFQNSVSIYINAFSLEDPSIKENVSMKVTSSLPDLSIPWVKILNEKGKEVDRCICGEILTIKAAVKNSGYSSANDVTVRFYCENSEKDCTIIGECLYDKVGEYQKYPSIKLDTSSLREGRHTITVEANCMEEINECNNEKSVNILVEKNPVDADEKRVLITEIYYYTHAHINNEYITLCNPTDSAINITNWYLTDQPSKRFDLQNKILFPDFTTLSPHSSITLSFNATAYKKEVGGLPDFEYGDTTSEDVKKCLITGTVRLNNKGDVIALKNRWNTTIDLVVYGDISYTGIGWFGKPVSAVDQGEVLKRRWSGDTPVDTNTSGDWKQNRRYGVGQSDFPPITLEIEGCFSAFVSPDCSFDVLSAELKRTDNLVLLNVYKITNLGLVEVLEDLLDKDKEVYILVEGNPVGGMKDEEKWLLKRLEEKGAQVYVMATENKSCSRYGFNHAKYAVIDNETVVIGSANWDNVGFPKCSSFGNREWGVVVKNKTLAEYFTEVFFEDCNPGRLDILPFDDFCGDVTYNLPCGVQQGSYEKHFTPLHATLNATVIPILSPDTSRQILMDIIDSAKESIYIEQLYIQLQWSNGLNPVAASLVNASRRGVDVKVILNCNPDYDNRGNLETEMYLKEHGMEVRLISPYNVGLTNIHTKGMIVDNKSVLISSINWNEQSLDKNREAGVVIINRGIAEYYATVFFYDWYSCGEKDDEGKGLQGYKNHVFILTLFITVSFLIFRDWKQRRR